MTQPEMNPATTRRLLLACLTLILCACLCLSLVSIILVGAFVLY